MQQDEALKMEMEQINSLINKGIDLSVPTSGWLDRLWYGKERTFTLTELVYGALDLIAAETIHMRLNEEDLSNNHKRMELISAHSLRCARIVAMAILNEKCSVRVGSKRIINHVRIDTLAGYLADRITPSKMSEIIGVIMQLINQPDFIGSIALLTGILRRTSQPRADAVETPASA